MIVISVIRSIVDGSTLKQDANYNSTLVEILLAGLERKDAINSYVQ
jgi:hypothetical protein